MKSKLLLIILLFSIQVTLAGEVVVDGTSAATTETSLSEMQKKLSDDEKVKFTLSLLLVQLSEVKSATELMSNQDLQTLNYELLAPKVDGLNYEEILALAEASPVKLEVQ